MQDCFFLVICYASKPVVMFPNTEISPRSNNWPDVAQDSCVVQAEATECLHKESKIAVCRLSADRTVTKGGYEICVRKYITL